ncbi:hypothetical protein EYR38_010722 [Pleurotus pulmonarius]|nr:hypothetical protein EYR38_010722 [Pleurotus pulmonarius]
MATTISESDVANLAVLLARHGLALSPQLQAISDVAPSGTAANAEAATAGPASTPNVSVDEAGVAVTDEPSETGVDSVVYIRCTHCNSVLTLDVRGEGPHSTPTPPKRWYAITVGRQIGVFHGVWESDFNHLVVGVPKWCARRFATEGQARTYYNNEFAAGRAVVHVDG